MRRRWPRRLAILAALFFVVGVLHGNGAGRQAAAATAPATSFAPWQAFYRKAH